MTDTTESGARTHGTPGAGGGEAPQHFTPAQPINGGNGEEIADLLWIIEMEKRHE